MYLLIQHEVCKGPSIKETVNIMFETQKKCCTTSHGKGHGILSGIRSLCQIM